MSEAVRMLEAVASATGRRINRGGELRIPGVCHQHEIADHRNGQQNLSIRADGDTLLAKCLSRDCSFENIMETLEKLTGITYRNRRSEYTPPARSTTEWAKPAKPAKSKTAYMTDEWEPAVKCLEPTPAPLEAWLWNRNLWPPGALLPPSIGWRRALPAGGNIILPMATPGVWAASAPMVPTPIGVQIIRIGEDGRKRPDGEGRDKISRGDLTDAVYVLGDATSNRYAVVEGLADALAVYAHSGGNRVVMMLGGTAGYKSRVIAAFLRGRDVLIHPDSDTPGMKEAKLLQKAVGKGCSIHVLKPGKDPADWGSRQPRLEPVR